MSKFTKPLVVSPIDGKMWRLVETFSYDIGHEGGLTIKVPAGFVTDFASIPAIFWSFIGHPMGRYAAAAVLHDYLYWKQEFSRKRSDEIFEEAMAVLRTCWLRRKIIYWTVRLFGWAAWWNNARRKKRNE